MKTENTQLTSKNKTTNQQSHRPKQRLSNYLGCFMLLMISIIGHAKDESIQLGQQTILIHEEVFGPGPTYIHVHQNETTALKAARAVAKQHGGRVITLLHKGTRNITFTLQRTRYEFDPNRIYTDTGIKKTLSQFGPYSSEAHRAVLRLAKAITQRLPKDNIIAVHNNQGYSIKNYQAGADAASEALKLYINPKKYYRNFYVVTQEEDFQNMKAQHENSVLQTPHPADDGSLSVFLAHRRYVNVEAGYDQLRPQIAMLERLSPKG